MTMRIILALMLPLAACAAAGTPAPDAGASLEVRPEQVSPGGSVTLVLRNLSTEGLGYNLCVSALERRDNGAWEPVPSDRVCTMELRMLAPDQEAEYRLQIPDTAAAGTYRYSTPVEWMDRGVGETISSDSFRVQP
jgi:hypothetical protein